MFSNLLGITNYINYYLHRERRTYRSTIVPVPGAGCCKSGSYTIYRVMMGGLIVRD